MGLLSSSSKSDQKVTNYNTSATGAVQAGAGTSTNLSGLTINTGATGKGSTAGALSLSLTDAGALNNAYDVADRAFSSVESALAGVSEFASSSLAKLTDAFKTSSQQTLQAFQASNDFTSDSVGTIQDAYGRTASVDSQKLIMTAVVGGILLGGIFLINRRKG